MITQTPTRLAVAVIFFLRSILACAACLTARFCLCLSRLSVAMVWILPAVEQAHLDRRRDATLCRAPSGAIIPGCD